MYAPLPAALLAFVRELVTFLLVLLVLALSVALGLVLVPPEALAKRPEHVLHVYKAERRMVLLVDGVEARSFKVALGGAPEGDKEREGDSKTPEGELYVAWKNAVSPFHRFLGLSYPMPAHAARGLTAKRITASEAKLIAEAAKARRTPPQQTRLGGYVGIHGGGSSYDWTLGCIAVTDAEIEALFDVIRTGDRVVVHP